MPAQPLKKLSEQHMLFVEYFIQTHGNATEAAKRAKFAVPGQKGHELKNDPLIKAEIDARLADVKQGAKVTSDAVIAELAAIAFANIDDYVRWSGGGEVPNPLYVSASKRAELEQAVNLCELLGQEVPKEVKTLLDAANNPLINTGSPMLTLPHKLELAASDDLTRMQKAAVGKVTFKPGEWGATVSVEVSNKLDALGKLANILGLNAPKKIEIAPTQLSNTKFEIVRRPKASPQEGVSSADTPS